MKKYATIALYAWIYLGWFACVLLGKYGFGGYSLIVPVLGGLLFFKALAPSPRDWLKAFFLSAAGILADSLALRLGLLHFTPETGLLPVWMLSLWLLFAPAIFLLSKPLGSRPWLAALLGGIVGPLSYKSGESFGVLSLAGLETLLIYAVFWALYTPLAISLVRPAALNGQP